jgi:hypothetical protein
VKKLIVTNLSKCESLESLKKQKGNVRLSYSVGIDEDNDKINMELNYLFGYEKIPYEIDLILIVSADLTKKLEAEPSPDAIIKLVDDLNPNIDKKIEELNNFLGTNVPSVSQVSSKGEENELPSFKKKEILEGDTIEMTGLKI